MIRELNNRNSNGISVSLNWDDSADLLFLSIETAEDFIECEIPKDKATEAFDHPFLFLSYRVARSPVAQRVFNN